MLAEMPESTFPEIIRSNLSAVVLTLKKLGIEDLAHFDFMEPPSPEAMMRALEMLHFLEAVDEECDLTDAGKKMADYPIDPHLGRTLIASALRGCCEEMLQVVAMLSVPTPFMRSRGAKRAEKAQQAFSSGLGDHLTLLGAFCAYRAAGAAKRATFCFEHWLNDRAMKQAESIHRQLGGIARSQGLMAAPVPERRSLNDAVRKSLLEGFFMQVAHLDLSGKQYLTVRDRQVCSIHPSSFLRHLPEWVLYHETVVTDRFYMRTVTAITPEMLIEVKPQFYHPDKGSLHPDAAKSLRRALPRAKV